jgi:tRNA (uracil-5-)-methyltransferase TRM9
MDDYTVSRLLEINREFYQTFAQQFSTTRQRLQPGINQILRNISMEASLLDLGCGNGQLAIQLSRQRYVGSYVGVDASSHFLRIAQEQVPNDGKYHFVEVDFASTDWDLKLKKKSFDLVFAFAVLHHLPTHHLRAQVLDKVHNLLTNSGSFIHSVWQPLNSPRLKARILPWTVVGLRDDQVDPGDYLIDWRQGGQGIRYIHNFNEDELTRLANQCGYAIENSFYSDGEAGRLGLYQIWKRV